MSDDKAKHNHTGQTPTDKPSKKLITPVKKKGIKRASKSDFNTTAKDPNLGSRNTTGR